MAEVENAKEQVVQVDNDEKEKDIIEYRENRMNLSRCRKIFNNLQRYYEKYGKDFMMYEMRKVQYNEKLQFFIDAVSVKHELHNEMVENRNYLGLLKSMESEDKRTNCLLESQEYHKKIVGAYNTYSSENLKNNMKDVIENKDKVNEQLITNGGKLECLQMWKNHILTDILINPRFVCKKRDLPAKYRNTKMLLERKYGILKTKLDQYKKNIGQFKKNKI